MRQVLSGTPWIIPFFLGTLLLTLIAMAAGLYQHVIPPLPFLRRTHRRAVSPAPAPSPPAPAPAQIRPALPTAPAESRPFRPVPLSKVMAHLKDVPHIAILGSSGAGKTTI